MRFIRALGAGGATTLLWAAGVGTGLAGCGAPAEVAKAPTPAKVMWGSSDVMPAAEAPSAAEVTPDSARNETEKRGGKPIEVDLDAPAPEEKKAEASKVEAAPEQEPAEQEEPAAATAAVEEPRAPRPLEKEMRAAVKSKEKKETTSSKPKKAVAEKSAPAEPAARAFSGPNPCKASSFSVTRVGDACATAGRSGAKAVMKDAIISGAWSVPVEGSPGGDVTGSSDAGDELGGLAGPCAPPSLPR